MFFVFLENNRSIILFQMQDCFAVMTHNYIVTKNSFNDLKFSTSHYKRYTIKLINIKEHFVSDCYGDVIRY